MMNPLAVAGIGAAILTGTVLGATGPGRVSPVVIAKDAVQPQVAVDADGRIHVVFLRNGNVEISSSTDGGKTYSRPITAMDAHGKAKGGLQRGPRVAVDGAGTVYVSSPLVFDPAELEKRYPAAELYLAASTDHGRTFGDPLQVNDVPRKAAEGLHWMEASRDGVVHLAWLDNRSSRAVGLWYARVSERGTKLEKNREISRVVCDCCAPGLDVDEGGNPHIVWRDGGKKPSREIFYTSSTDGGESFAVARQVNKTPTRLSGCPMNAPAVGSTRSDKGVVVTWMGMGAGAEDRRLFWATIDRGGIEERRTTFGSGKGYRGHPATEASGRSPMIAWEDEQRGSSQIWLGPRPGKALPLQTPDGYEARFPAMAYGSGRLVIVAEGSRERSQIVLGWTVSNR